MNLYLISQHINNDYDTYDSAIVCADTEDDARMTHPGGYDDWDGEDEKYSLWCAAKDVQIEKIGTADKSLPTGIVIASYNAG